MTVKRFNALLWFVEIFSALMFVSNWIPSHPFWVDYLVMIGFIGFCIASILIVWQTMHDTDGSHEAHREEVKK